MINLSAAFDFYRNFNGLQSSFLFEVDKRWEPCRSLGGQAFVSLNLILLPG